MKESSSEKSGKKLEQKAVSSLFNKLNLSQTKIKQGFYKFFLSFWKVSYLITVGIIVAMALLATRDLVSVVGMKIWPSAYDPVARFVANMNWETNTLHLDATMSKAFEDKIEKYIWRIDDGTSLVGGEKLDHTFSDPGYYYIQLSIVDQNQQSDVATCQILIPPAEVEKVSMAERLETRGDESLLVEDTDYIWAPVGTFYNYSKIPEYKQSYSDLRSRYVDSGCGLSSSGYNIQDVSSNVSYQTRQFRKIIASLSFYAIELVIASGVYLLVKKGLTKELKKIES